MDGFTGALLGKIRRLISAQELGVIFRKEGVRNIPIKPMRGRFLILTFVNKEERDLIINEKWLLAWFEEIKPWTGVSAKDKRFAWISCFGMPLNAWSIPTFRQIGSRWGHFLQVDYNTLRESSYEKGRFLITAEYAKSIEGKLPLDVEGINYTTRLAEEDSFRVLSSSKLGTEQMPETGAKFNEEDDDVDRSGNEEDDEVDRRGKDRRPKETFANELLDDMANQSNKDADKEANKENGDCPKVILLGYSSEQAGVGEQAIKDGVIKSYSEKEQHIEPPETAKFKAQDIFGKVNEESSNSTHGLFSLGEDSECSLQEGNKEPEDCLENLTHSNEAQEFVGAGLEELQKEVERNLGSTLGPILIGSNNNIRASQVDKRTELLADCSDESLLTICEAINGARYCESKLHEWSDEVDFLEMKVAENDGKVILKDDATDNCFFFGEEIKSLADLEMDLLMEIIAGLLHQFETLSQDYIQTTELFKREEDIGQIRASEGIDFSITVEFLEALDTLKSRLCFIDVCLNPKDFSDLWRSVADGLDRFIFSSILLSDYRLSDKGTNQLGADMRALFLVFQPFCARPEAFFPCIRNSLKLLEMDRVDLRRLQVVSSNALERTDCLHFCGITHISFDQAQRIVRNWKHGNAPTDVIYGN